MSSIWRALSILVAFATLGGSAAGCANGLSSPMTAIPTARSIAAGASGYSNDANASQNGVPLVFVSDLEGNTVNIYDVHGTPTGQLTGFSAPTGVAVAANRDLYVADSSNSEIKIYKAGYTQPPTRIEVPGQTLRDLKISATGLIAVLEVSSDGLNSVSFYQSGSKQSCKTLSSPDLPNMYFGTFDANGVFYVDGYSPTVVSSVGRIIGGCSAASIAVQQTPNSLGQVAGMAVNSKGQVLIGDADRSTIFTYNVMKGGQLSLDKTTTLVDTNIVWGFVLKPSDDNVLVANGGFQQTGSGWDEYTYPFAHSAIVSVTGLLEAYGIAMTPAQNAIGTW